MVAEAPIQKRNAAPRIPILVKYKARNLFLALGLSHSEIANQTGLTIPAVSQLISREGWAKEKRARISRMEQNANTRLSRMDDEAFDAIAAGCTEVALSGVDKARQAVQRDDRDAARDFASYANGVKSLVSTAQAIRAPASVDALGQGATLNLFFCASPNKANASDAAKAVDQVTEIAPASNQLTKVTDS